MHFTSFFSWGTLEQLTTYVVHWEKGLGPSSESWVPNCKKSERQNVWRNIIPDLGPLEHRGDKWSNENYIMSFGPVVKFNFGTLDFVLEPRPEKYYKRKRLVIHTAKCFFIFYKLSNSSITESVFNLAHLNLHI